MNFRPVFRVVSFMLGGLALGMALCGLVSIFSADGARVWQALLYSAAGIFAGSSVIFFLTKGKVEVSRRDGLGVVAFGWLLAGLAGALPYIFSGVIPNVWAAIFESVSGLTTTGASVLGILEEVPAGILLWRALTQFLGGMGVLILVVAVLPFLGIGGMQLYRAEITGPSKDRIEPRVASTAKLLWGVYIALTLLAFVLLKFGGMTWFDSLCHALTVMSSGGFSTHTLSIAGYNSLYIEMVLLVFMLLAGINFALHYRLLRGEWRPLWQDWELRVYLGLFAGVTLVGTSVLCVAGSMGGWSGWAHSLRQVGFTVASTMTSTGFTTADYETWPSIVKGLLVVLMITGGCAGSTAGGLKVIRVWVLWKATIREIRRFMQPQAVIPIRLGRKAIGDDVLIGILSFVLLYLMTALLGMFLMMPFTPDIKTAVTAVISSMGNVGPAFGAVGPMANFSVIPDGGKAVLTFLMLLGRLELYTLFVIFIPAFWRK